MRILSLFDGMACGMLAMIEAGVEVERYVAYEIDKYAIKTSTHNFPMIEQRGDVFQADFTEFEGFDFVIGGSPCTYWSIAQKNNRETQASGMGWELFSQYVRAIREAKPKYFIYENNKSMSKAIRASIDAAFGFEAVYINSALVSAQNRQRLYWVGKRNEDGTYSKVNVEQPEDRGILLKDILECGTIDKDKAYCLKHQAGNTRDYFKKHHTQIAAEPVCMRQVGRRINESGHRDDANEDINHEQRYEVNKNPQKTNCVSSVSKDNVVAEPVRIPEYGNADKSRPITAGYRCKGTGEWSLQNEIFPDNPNKQKFDYVAEPVRIGTWPNNAKNQDRHDSQQYRIYSTEGKGVTLCGNGGGMGAKTGLYSVPVPGYATPCEWDEDGKPIKAISCADGKVYTVYEVKDGKVTIKGKEYPIKLVDGYYIFRKLTVRECMRLQTVPEWYEFPVSDSQAYKMLGNGWTVSVIDLLVSACLAGETSEEQTRLF